jgi:hypothetical protein
MKYVYVVIGRDMTIAFRTLKAAEAFIHRHGGVGFTLHRLWLND